MRRITITEALNELKLYDEKITKLTNQIQAVGVAKKSSKTIGTKTIESFNEDAVSKFESISQLIINRADMKAKIVASNAITTVLFNGEMRTVAELIERKTSIGYYSQLADVLRRQLYASSVGLANENAKVQKQLDEMLTVFLGKQSEKKASSEDYANIVNPYMEKNESVLIDPLKIESRIDTLDNIVQDFNANVNTALVVSNSVTYIEVE